MWARVVSVSSISDINRWTLTIIKLEPTDVAHKCTESLQGVKLYLAHDI